MKPAVAKIYNVEPGDLVPCRKTPGHGLNRGSFRTPVQFCLSRFVHEEQREQDRNRSKQRTVQSFQRYYRYLMCVDANYKLVQGTPCWHYQPTDPGTEPASPSSEGLEESSVSLASGASDSAVVPPSPSDSFQSRGGRGFLPAMISSI